MDRKKLESKIIEFVATSYNEDQSEITLETNFAKDLSGSSLQMVSLVALVENELDAMVPMTSASASETVKDFVDCVEEVM